MKNELYEVSIIFRGHSKKIADLKPNSKMKVKMKCASCAKHFERYASRLFESGSFECQACVLKEKLSKHLEVGMKKNKLTVIGKSEKSGYSLFVCECGNKKEVLNRLFMSGHTKTCGCAKVENMRHVHSMQDHKKENHPNWQGGISSENLLLRTSKEYKTWRMAVFERDNYLCQKCGTRGGELNAHHVKEFANHKDEIYDVNNGVTFCGKCHREFHSIFGQNNLTLKQVLHFTTKDKKCLNT